MTVVSVFKDPALTRKNLTLTGEVKFSNLREPKKAPNADDKDLKYEVVLVFDADDPTVARIDGLLKDGIEAEKKLSKKKLAEKPTMFEADFGLNKEDTGRLMLRVTKNARRKVSGQLTELPPPQVVNALDEPIERSFIRRGSKVEVTFDAKSYVMGAAGISIRMTKIKILEEARSPRELEAEAASEALVTAEDSVL